ncbi:MAG: YhcN/YlaJ family sporulation lipoprotein [Clostridia bacterium]|nr:YhcN/YlaJ family sporulation lipoprotein [Clostridia bacterium]
MKVPIITALAIALCLHILSLSACTSPGRTSQSPDGPFSINEKQDFPKNIVSQATPHPNSGQLLGTQSNKVPKNNRTDTIPQNISPNITQPNILTPQSPVSIDKQRGDIITSDLIKRRGIQRVTTIVNGDIALVGYTHADSIRDVATVKNMIANRVKELDTSIMRVEVSESAYIHMRMRQLSDDMANNKSESEIKNSFSRLLEEAEATGNR